MLIFFFVKHSSFIASTIKQISLLKTLDSPILRFQRSSASSGVHSLRKSRMNGNSWLRYGQGLLINHIIVELMFIKILGRKDKAPAAVP